MIGSGTTPDSNNPAYYDGEHFWIQSGDLYECDVLTSTKRTITTLAVESSSAIQFYENEFVVVAMYGASVGNAAISQISGYVIQACCVLVPDNDNDVRFLFYWFTACKNDLISQSLGGGQPNISQQKIKNEPYLQPPIDELQSIANYLDDKFFAINNIINTKKQLINSLSEYKQSLIYEVVTGKRKVCNP
jgi:type I restriction enzyme S subunit